MALTDNILAYWKLDKNGSGEVSLVDSTGNSNTLTNNGGVALGTGKIGGGSVFDGIGDTSLTNNNTFSVNPTTGSNSVGLWIKPSGYATEYNIYDGYIHAAFIYASSNLGLLLALDDVGNLRGSVNGTSFNTEIVIPLNSWSHITAVQGNGSLNIYINGALVFTHSATLGFWNNGQILTIGSQGNGAPNKGWPFNGSIDEVGIWSRALSSTEVTTLYNGGSGLSYPFSPPLYFNAAVNGSLTTLGNWWQDASLTIPATAIPDETKSVVISANVTSGTGSYGYATINSASIGSSVSITASYITLNGTSSNAGTLVGVTTLNNTASNTGTITGSAEFFDTTDNTGTVEGDAILWNSSSNAGGTIEGNATIYNPSANPIAGVVMGTETYLWPNGTGWWSDKYYIGGTETTLPESGTGWWSDKYYIGGTETTLNDNGIGIWNENCYVNGQVNNAAVDCNGVCGGSDFWTDSCGNACGYCSVPEYGWFDTPDCYYCLSRGYYINYQLTTLNENGTGWWSDKFWISGVETTLNEDGIGIWNDNCYIWGSISIEGDCGCSLAMKDCDGVCDGGNNWYDCQNTRCGSDVADDCGECNGNNASKDCNGVCGGSGVWTDCAGTQCGIATPDCNGNCDGGAVVDDCGVCNGNNASKDSCGTCGGNLFISETTTQWVGCLNKYYVGGVQTTLPESGTGTWNNAYYMAGVATQLDANGNGFHNGLFHLGGVLASGPVQFSNVPPSPPAWGNFTYYQQGAVVSDNGSLWLLVSTGGWTVGGRPGLGYGWQKLSTGEGGLPTPSVNLAQLLGLPPFVQL